METAQLRNQIQNHAAQLSEARLKIALEFLSYLVNKENLEDEATQELLDIHNFEKELLEAEKQADAGELTDWRSIRNDVF
ncbi:MAG: hypothetical protein AAFV85_01445 [Cyanobacteria bacterium J06634_6]